MTSNAIDLVRVLRAASVRASGAARGAGISSRGGQVMMVTGGRLLRVIDPLSEAALNADRRGEVLTCGAGHLPVADFDLWLLSEDRHLSLAIHAYTKATWTYNDDKLRGLARALREGIDDDTRVEEGELVVTALGALAHPHITVLRIIAKDDPQAWYEIDRAVKPIHGNWKIAALARRLPTYASIIAPIEMTLRRVGIIHRSQGTFGGQRDDVQVTPFGQICLAYMEGLDRPSLRRGTADAGSRRLPQVDPDREAWNKLRRRKTNSRQVLGRR